MKTQRYSELKYNDAAEGHTHAGRGNDGYTIVDSMAMMFHRDYMYSYSCTFSKHFARSVVDSFDDCEVKGLDFTHECMHTV